MNFAKKHESALQSLIDEIKQDKNVICIMHDENLQDGLIDENAVIGIFVVVKDDTYDSAHNTCIHDDIIFEVVIWGRLQMMQDLSRQLGDVLRYSGFSHMEVVFSRDDQFVRQFNDIRTMRAQTFAAYMMESAANILNRSSKIKKHLALQKDTTYAQFQFIQISEYLARMEHLRRQLPIPDDVVIAAMKLNPTLMEYFNTQAMLAGWDTPKCIQALACLDAYLTEHIEALSSILQLCKKYKKEIITLEDMYPNFHIPGWSMYPLLKFLSDKGLLTLVTTPVKLTRKSKVELETIAFFCAQEV